MSSTLENESFRGSQVLIVDDHPQMRKAMLRLMETFGVAKAFEATNPEEAIATLEEHPIDLAIIDLYLGEAKGFAIIEHIRNSDTNADIPILVVTGEASKDEIVRAADLGTNEYLVKPFQTADFRNKIIQLYKIYSDPKPFLKVIRFAERCYFKRQYEKAQVAVDKALEIDPTSARALHIKALLLDKLSQSTEAIQLLEKVIATNNSYYRSYKALADIYIRMRKATLAIDYMIKELEFNPRQIRRQAQLAAALLEAGRVAESIDRFRESLKEDVRYLPALFGMGKALAQSGNLEKAVYYYKRARRYHPTNTRCLEAIVKCCMDANDPLRAEMALKDELKLNKNRLDTHIVLARFYMAKEEVISALATLDEAIAKNADFFEAARLKGHILAKEGKYQEAIAIYKSVIQKDRSVETRFEYIQVLISGGKFSSAIDLLHQLMKFQVDRGRIFEHLCQCYIKTKQFLKATAIGALLKSINPGSAVLGTLEKEAKAQLELRTMALKSSPDRAAS